MADPLDPILWSFPPNWRDSVEMVRAYRTDLATSRSGREQRRALRASPRRRLSIPITAHEAGFRRFVRSLQAWQNRPVLIGDPVRWVGLEAAAPAASTTATFDRLLDWVAVDAVLLFETAERVEMRVIDSIDAETREVAFTAVTDYVWPLGTRIRPTLTGRFSADVQSTNATNRTVEAVVSFDVEPGSEAAPDRASGVFQHNGREVFMTPPNWGETISTGYQWPVEQVDFGHGRIASYTPVDFGTMIRQGTFVGQTATEAGELESFFDRMYGRRGEFYMSTGLDDLPPVEGLTVGAATIRIEGVEPFDLFADDPVYRAICVTLGDGRRLFRSIAEMSVDAGDTVIEVSEPWLSDVALSDIAMVSWLPVFRFGSDEMTTEWINDEVAQTQLAMQTLEDLVAEGELDTLDGAARWILEVWGLLAGTRIIDRLDYAVNGAYPAIFWHPLAWVWVNEGTVDDFDWLVNTVIPENLGENL